MKWIICLLIGHKYELYSESAFHERLDCAKCGKTIVRWI